MNKDVRKYLFVVLLLVVFGSIMVFSTSWPFSYITNDKNPYKVFIIHVTFVILSFIAMGIISFINVYKFKKYSKSIFYFSIFIGLLVFVPGLGKSINSARRWVGFGPLTFMPSDLVKICSIIAMAFLIDRNKNKFVFNRVFKKYFMICILAGGVVLIQPDFSTAVIILSSITAMYIVAGMDKKTITFSLSSIAVAIVGVLVFMSSGYSRTSRISAFLDPLKYRDSKSWQLIKSLFAITNGSLFGVGLGNGRQKLSLSEAHNDFIFATIAEEFGFIGSVMLIGLYIYLALLGIRIANSIKDVYGKMIVMGINFLIGLQAIVNIGTATGMVPPTGVTLPFISYGGSSLLMLCVMVGMVVSISKYSVKEK